LPDPPAHSIFLAELNRKNGFTQLTRPELVAAVILTYRGAPPRPLDQLQPQLRTLIEFANGTFNEAEFLAGSSTWRIRRGLALTLFVSFFVCFVHCIFFIYFSSFSFFFFFNNKQN
jgi:hypothetical protein